MHQLRRTIIAGALLLCCLLSTALEAALKVEVDTYELSEMDTLRINIRAAGGSSDLPDLAVLEKDFELLGHNTSSQFRSINGKVDSWVEHQLHLRPKKIGTLTVPAIQIGAESTEPVEIVVKALDPQLKRNIAERVFFESSISPSTVYVQSQLVLVRKLYYSNGVQIYSDLPGPPAIADAIVLSLGETKSYTEERGDNRYGVLEQRYAVFPEASGELLIPEISLTSSIRLNDGNRARRTSVRVVSEEIKLPIQPVPAKYPKDQPWLPATDVVLAETWQPQPPKFEVGVPLTRTLSVSVTGNVGSVIPPLLTDQAIAADKGKINVYPEPVNLDDATAGINTLGTRVEAYSMIPTAPGTQQLGAVSLTWWDTSSNEVKVARLPARQANIVGDAPNLSSTAAAADPDTPAVTPQPTNTTPSMPDATTDGWSWLGWLVAACISLGWLLTLRRNKKLTSTSLQPLEPTETAQNANQAYQHLKSSCRADDVVAIKSAYLDWVSRHTGYNRSATLNTIAAHENSRKLVAVCNRALYKRKDKSMSEQTITVTGLGKQALLCAEQLQSQLESSQEQTLKPLYSR